MKKKTPFFGMTEMSHSFVSITMHVFLMIIKCSSLILYDLLIGYLSTQSCRTAHIYTQLDYVMKVVRSKQSDNNNKYECNVNVLSLKQPALAP